MLYLDDFNIYYDRSLEMNTFMFDKLEDPHPTTCSRIKNRFTEDKSNGQHGEKNDPERYEWLVNIRDASGKSIGKHMPQRSF